MSTIEQTTPDLAAPIPADDLRVFVGNLPLAADAKLLKTVFSDAGARAQVNVARVARAQREKNRYAIITFKSQEDKTKGVEGLTKRFGSAQGSGESEAAATSDEAISAESAALRFGVAPPKPKTPKTNKKSAKKPSVDTGSTSTNGDSSEAKSAAASSGDSTPKEEASQKKKGAPKPKRAAKKFVPRPSAVYVMLPPHTEADEVRELLSGFPSVEIKLGHKRGRTVTRRTKRVEIPERTFAVVTVGEEHQQRAIEQLNGKELRDFKITAKPSSQRLLAEDAAAEARAVKKEDEAAPEAQPIAEHAENAAETTESV